MSERWEDLGGQRPEPVEPAEPAPAPPQHRGKPHHRPFCGKCVDGWLEHPETHYPTRRCECRENH